MSPPDPTTRRIAAVFGLTLLEVIRSQDRPAEILQDENPSVTLPRRLGLSDVVDRQIRQYGEAVKKRRRMTETEVIDLMGLVLRRPDAEEIFLRAGQRLADVDGSGPGRIARALPTAVAFRLARRRTGRRLRQLFGNRIGAFTSEPYALEGRSLLFYRADSRGAACSFITGLCQEILREAVGEDGQVVHSECEARGDAQCRWTATGEIRAREREPVGDLLRGPEPELEAG
ncbi:MAG: hypothetical protein KJO11_07490 [Gemmatimonadetes bacterium]|nr:hypothetical protein [Gemmatimonadota bacterium]MBT8402671.1 hypothetical protein [Gemmatimonadota bacterium]NNK63078.1 hypothetical protein [Gemmatimonadota bacterium]